MKGLYEEIYDFFLKKKGEPAIKGELYSVEHLAQGYEGFLFDEGESRGALVPTPGLGKFREAFSNAVLESVCIVTDGEPFECLQLSTKLSGSEIGPFSQLCASFLETSDGARERIMSNPGEWCDKWRSTLGNKEYDRAAFPVMAELLLVKELLSAGYSVDWVGPERGVNDVVTRSPTKLSFEVKSTISRESKRVSFSEEFQIPRADYVCFYRFEDTDAGDLTLESLVDELNELGFDRHQLEEGLSKTGLINTRECRHSYNLLESRCYRVDDDFPELSRYFVDGVIPSMFGSISYSLDLSNLKECQIPEARSGANRL